MTKKTLKVGLIAAVVVAAVPAAAIHAFGILVLLAAIAVLALWLLSDTTPAGFPRRLILPGLMVAALVLVVAPGALKVIAAIAFWVFLVMLVSPHLKNLCNSIAALLAKARNTPVSDGTDQAPTQ